MNKKIIFVVLFFIMIFVNSCDLTSEKRFTDDVFFVWNILHVGSYIGWDDNPLIFGQSIEIDGNSFDDMFSTFDEAEVKITNMAIDSTIVLTPLSDSLNFVFFDESQQMLIEQNTKYRLDIDYIFDGEPYHIEAETTTPDSTQIIDNQYYISDPETEDFVDLPFEDINEVAPIKIVTSTGEEQYLQFEFYCLEDYQNAFFTSSIFSGPLESDEEYEDPATGAPRKIKFMGRYTPVLENEQYVITENTNQSAFVFYGRYMVTVYNLDDNYNEYLNSAESYSHGGINGGIGLFGSISGEKIYTKIVE